MTKILHGSIHTVLLIVIVLKITRIIVLVILLVTVIIRIPYNFYRIVIDAVMQDLDQ